MLGLDWSSVLDVVSGFLAQAEPPAELPAAKPEQAGIREMLPIFAGMGVLFYLLLIRPQRKQMREHENLLKGLKKHDEVRTSAGIFGKVVSIEPDQDQVVLEVDENRNVRLRVLRSSIVAVLGREKKDDTPAAAAAGKPR